jgi:hypothetical protein
MGRERRRVTSKSVSCGVHWKGDQKECKSVSCGYKWGEEDRGLHPGGPWTR